MDNKSFCLVMLQFGLVILLSLAAVNAFTPGLTRQTSQLIFARGQPRQPFLTKPVRFSRQSSCLFQSSDGSSDKQSGDSTKKPRKKRVKRKETTSEAKPEGQAKSSPELKPRQDAAVNLQVRDVRDLVGDEESSSATPSNEVSTTSSAAEMTSPVDSASSPAPAWEADKDSSENDSLERLLQDAREMQALEKKDATGGVSGGSVDDTEFSLPDTFRKILSTIVTVDFFVVCGFLLWFLAGIFCSYILKDDTVQIAFNQLFQPVVQPALGILMIGSIVGSTFGEDENEEV